jgi:uncharacterized membrane-anchored protein
MVGSAEEQGSKVPEVTLVFWIIKIAATTLGETFGETVTMTLNWGYLVGTVIFFLLLIALVVWQIAVNRFHPFLYWATIISSTTAGTTMADFADRSLGLGYAGGATLQRSPRIRGTASQRFRPMVGVEPSQPVSARDPALARRERD